MTLRSSYSSAQAPSTEFQLYAMHMQTEQATTSSTGRWLVKIWVEAINRGSSGSWSGEAGYHRGLYRQASSGGWRIGANHTANPFIPAGVATGAKRWSKSFDLWVTANSNGYVRDSSTQLDLLHEIQSNDSNFLGGSGVTYVQRQTSIPLPRIVQKPTPPRDLALVSRTANSITVKWSAPSNNGGSSITGYRVEYATNSSFSGSKVVSASSSPFTITGLGLNDYWIRVYANNSRLQSSASNVLKTATVSVPGAPPVPTLTSRTSSQIVLSLANPSYVGNGITAREVEYSTASNFSGAAKATVSGTTATLSGLNRATKYYTRYRVQNSTGWSAWTTSNSTTLVAKPSAPTNYYVSDIAYTSALLNLGAVVDTGGSALAGTKYEVRIVSTGAVYSQRELSVYSPMWFNFPPGDGLVDVRMAVKNSGTGAQWSDFGEWIRVDPNEHVPSNPTVTLTVLGDTSLRGTWAGIDTELNDSEIWGIRLMLSTTSEFTDDVLVYDMTPSDVTLDFDGLQPGTQYYLQVHAISSNGPGSRNVPAATATTTGTRPGAKPNWMRDGGTWKSGQLWQNVLGDWKKITMWQNVEDEWRTR